MFLFFASSSSTHQPTTGNPTTKSLSSRLSASSASCLAVERANPHDGVKTHEEPVSASVSDTSRMTARPARRTASGSQGPCGIVMMVDDEAAIRTMVRHSTLRRWLSGVSGIRWS